MVFTDSKGRKIQIHMMAYNNVTVITACALLDVLKPDWLDNYNSQVHDEMIIEWLTDNNARGYSRPRDSFSTREAADIAFKEGKMVTVVEDLS